MPPTNLYLFARDPLPRPSLTMTLYTLRVILFPNPPFFEGDREVWREIHIDDSHTLEDLHNAIFEAFDRWDQHLYEFDTYNEYELPTRAYVHPSQYEGGPSWPPMNEDEIDRMLDQMSMDNPPEGAIEYFREARADPPPEGNVADTTIQDLDLEEGGAMYYLFDFGDNWEHRIEVREVNDGSLEGPPRVVAEHGEAPDQYPDPEDMND